MPSYWGRVVVTGGAAGDVTVRAEFHATHPGWQGRLTGIAADQGERLAIRFPDGTAATVVVRQPYDNHVEVVGEGPVPYRPDPRPGPSAPQTPPDR